MGKKSKKQRKAERASKVVCEPKASSEAQRALGLLKSWKPRAPGLFTGIDPAAPGGDKSVFVVSWGEGPETASFSAGLVRESTLPSAITDLLKVEAPKRYSTIPPHANHCKAEDRFEYLKGMRAGEPVALRCPDCDVRLGFAQSRDTMFSRAFGGESFNRCRYCGVTYTFHGSRLVWWR